MGEKSNRKEKITYRLLPDVCSCGVDVEAMVISIINLVLFVSFLIFLFFALTIAIIKSLLYNITHKQVDVKVGRQWSRG